MMMLVLIFQSAPYYNTYQPKISERNLYQLRSAPYSIVTLLQLSLPPNAKHTPEHTHTV